MREETRLIHAGRNPEANCGAVNPPVFHASTILHPSVSEMKAKHASWKNLEHTTFYGRRGTPTTFAFAEAIAELEGGFDCVLFPSGLAAIGTALLAYLSPGDHFLVPDNVYGPVRHLAETLLKRLQVETTYYPPLIGAGIEALIRPNTRVVYTESPGSHTFEVQDVPAIAHAAHAKGALIIFDNTWATPLFFRAFEHGADVSIQSVTKYIIGHSDALLGAVTTNEAAWPQMHATTYAMGQCVAPDDVYLAQRGLRTLAVRLRHHQQAALDLARWLQERPEVARVLHPGLPEDPGYALWKRDFTGSSGLFGVEFKACSKDSFEAMIDGLELFGIGASWGGYESLMVPSEAAVTRTSPSDGAAGPLARIHVGLENLDDLKADLEAGLARLVATP